MNVVAARTRHAVTGHHALHEVVALHPILVRGAVGKVGERRLAELVILEPPEVSEVEPDAKPDRPVVRAAIDRTAGRPALRMALGADVVGMPVVHPCGVEDVSGRRMRDVLGATTMAALAADVPLGDPLGLHVVADRMAAIAQSNT